MAQQQTEPRASSFGLADNIQLHDIDDTGQGTPRRSSSKRRVAVSRRGPSSKRTSVDLDDGEESNEGDHGDAVDDLDASADTDDSNSDDGSDDLDGDGDGDDVNAGAGDEGDEDEGGKKPNSRGHDAKTRKQWEAANTKQAAKIESLEKRLDGQDARNAQANAAQSQQQRAAKEGDPENELDELFDEITAGNEADGEEFVTASQVKARDKQRKSLQKMVETQVTDAVAAQSEDEIRALFAVPGARAAYNEAHEAGLVDKLRAKHRFVAPLIYALMTERHGAEIKKLTAEHKVEISKLKEKSRQGRLDEIPAGNGSRGSGRAGSKGRNRRPKNDLVAAMDHLNEKYGNTPSR